MKFLMSFVLMVPLLAAAGEMERMPGGGYPRPGIPNPKYCPDGTHRVFDEYKGRYICVADDYGNEPRPMPGPWCGPDAYCLKPTVDPMERMSGQLKAIDHAVETGSLEGFFDASLGSRKNGGFTKVQQNDPSWGGATGRPPVIEPIRPTRPDPRPEPRPEPRPSPPSGVPQLPTSPIGPNPGGTIRPAGHFVKLAVPRVPFHWVISDMRTPDKETVPNVEPRPVTPKPGPKKPGQN